MIEWDAVQVIVSPYVLPADLSINVVMPVPLSSGMLPFFRILDPKDFSVIPGKFRPVVDSFSQADGSSIQPPYIDGVLATMSVAYQVLAPDADPTTADYACGEDRRQMDEMLMGTLNALRNYPTDVSTQQWLWLPYGSLVYRLLDAVMLASWPAPDYTNDPPEFRRKFSLQSPYPYALTDAPHTNPLDGTTGGYLAPGDTMTVANDGNMAGLPIVFAPGPGTNFTLVNETTGYQISYDSTRPGGIAIPSGHVLQIDFHEGSCLLDGDPNLDYIAGMNPATDDFWALAVGNTSVENLAGGDLAIQMVSYDYWTP